LNPNDSKAHYQLAVLFARLKIKSDLRKNSNRRNTEGRRESGKVAKSSQVLPVQLLFYWLMLM